MKQAGYAMISVAVVMVMICFVIVTGFSDRLAVRARNDFYSNQRAYILEVERQLSTWYDHNAGSVDAVADPPDMYVVMDQLGVERKWNVVIEASTRLSNGDIAYRVIAAWIPAESNETTVFDTGTGAITPGPNTTYVTVNGYQIQAKKYLETLKSLKSISAKLEGKFKSAFLNDPDHSTTTNYFRPLGSCSSAQADEIPCIDSYSAVGTAGISSVIGLDQLENRDAWGGAVEVSNLQDAQISGPPYTMAVRATAPWGSIFRVSAVQPL